MGNSGKVARESLDTESKRRLALRELYPEVFTEGLIDFDKLRTLLGETVDSSSERYSFSWAGKRNAMHIAQTSSLATLSPMKDQSVDFEATQNVFVEGDNLEVLKLLARPYFSRIKTIYIDPPYNTGNDFVYPDNYSSPLDTYLQMTGQKDANGNLLTSNADTNGRYHSAWLSMMYPRLLLARQLMSEDGAIFISIDDNEVHHLRLLMNEIFGESNFIAQIIWEKRSGPPNDKIIGSVHEYILVYARNIEHVQLNLLPRDEENLARYTNPDDDPRGPWAPGDLSANAKGGRFVESLYYEIENPQTGQKHLPPEGACWRFSKETVKQYIEEGVIYFGSDNQGRPKIKRYLSEVRDGLTVPTIWSDLATNTHARSEIREYFDDSNTFETPKPQALMKRILEISTLPNQQHIILDFFAGSASMAQAVLEMNHSDQGNRRYIMVQLPEGTGRDDLPTLADVGRERIRRVVKKVQEDDNGKLEGFENHSEEDFGFRAFRLTKSNYRPDPDPESMSDEEYREQLELFAETLLVDGWDATDVIYEVALKEGYGLNIRVEEVSVENNTVYHVTDPDKEQSFYICLDEMLRTDIIDALGLTPDDLFICHDKALDDTLAANLALQARLQTL